MKFIISILVTALLVFACGLYLPWWSLAIASFIVALCIPLRPLYGFIAGFLGLVLCYSLVAIMRDNANDSILSAKVAGIFPLGGSAFLLITVTCLVFGLVSGFAALSASFLAYKPRSV